MNRSTWMYNIRRSDPAYLKGVQDFLTFAENNRVNSGSAKIYCPCIDCKIFVRHSDIKDIEYHLITRGFVQKYTCWSKHGELLGDNSTSVHITIDNENGDSYINDYCENSNEMSDNVEDTTGDNDQEKLQTLLEESQKPLYAGCTKFSILSGVLKLFGVKAKHRWTDTSFTDLLEAVHEMLPTDNGLPISLYQAKKMMCPTDLEVERIHACPNDCILYRDTYENIHRCPICKESRYKSETKINDNEMKYGPPAKLLWYLPIIPRLKRLFANEKDAKLLRWHSDERKKDGKLRHVADSPQWRKINNKYEEFGGEIRNIRFGLSSDGINPFGNMSSKHSTWPVLLCIYNLPPWLCMKRKYIMMSLLIECPKQHGNHIDIYLAPLIDDLKTLWGKGVNVYDAYKKDYFQMRAMIFCTISDFPAYDNLSGYSTKGKFVCPVCEDQTFSRWLSN